MRGSVIAGFFLLPSPRENTSSGFGLGVGWGLGIDIEWMCKQAGGLAEHRNNLVHAPLGYMLNPDNSSEVTGVGPITFFYHPRALKLEGKDLVAEFDKCRALAKELKLFARRIYVALSFYPAEGWPSKPEMQGFR